jgi:hypothetical protein
MLRVLGIGGFLIALGLSDMPAMAQSGLSVCDRIAVNCGEQAAGDPEAFVACWIDQGASNCPADTTHVVVPVGGKIFGPDFPDSILNYCSGRTDCDMLWKGRVPPKVEPDQP